MKLAVSLLLLPTRRSVCCCMLLLAAAAAALTTTTTAFSSSRRNVLGRRCGGGGGFATTTTTTIPASMTTSSNVAGPSSSSYIINPSEREEKYGKNMAQYLVDLHDSQATFDFCGGMLFQLVLSDKLKEHLTKVAAAAAAAVDNQQPIVYSAGQSRMFRIPNYKKSDAADNRSIFHGREIRKAPKAAGGMGFCLQLSLANESDPQGWTLQEVAEYDGWGHDSGRTWRTGERYEAEGFAGFREQFGPQSFGLHHRFYFHLDRANRLWLSAEDGCEGTPAAGISGDGGGNAFSNLLGGLMGR